MVQLSINRRRFELRPRNSRLMLDLRPIDSADFPELNTYKTLRRTADQRNSRTFVVQGGRNVQFLLESRFSVVSVLLSSDWLSRLRPLLEQRQELITVFLGSKALVEEIIGYRMYQGVMAVSRMPTVQKMGDWLRGCAVPRLLAAVDGITSAENMGGLVRNCGAFGVQGLLVSASSCSPFLRRAVRSSMGGIFELPVLEVKDLVKSLQHLHQQGVSCIAAVPGTLGKQPESIAFTDDCCLVFGSEGEGISNEIRSVCQGEATIPMRYGVDSLNVATAAAIFFYQAARVRGTRNRQDP